MSASVSASFIFCHPHKVFDIASWGVKMPARASGDERMHSRLQRSSFNSGLKSCKASTPQLIHLHICTPSKTKIRYHHYSLHCLSAKISGELKGMSRPNMRKLQSIRNYNPTSRRGRNDIKILRKIFLLVRRNRTKREGGIKPRDSQQCRNSN